MRDGLVQPPAPRIVTCDNRVCAYHELRTVVKPVQISEHTMFDPSAGALLCASCGWLMHVLGPDEVDLLPEAKD